MKPSHARSLVAFATLIALGSAALRPAAACMLVGAHDTKIGGEEVLIAWNARTHTEHFVRHLSFRDADHDFGFLVPTPNRPELGEVDDALFRRLFWLYRAPEQPDNSGLRLRGLHAAGAVPSNVEVVEQRRVAGLDATVLLASDPAALSSWLTAHHYASTPSLTAYLAPYVQRHFYVTAFRFEPGSDARSFGTRALRMSFQADAPFFPYAEPTDAATVPGRVFRISVISNERVEGRVGSARWTARTAYAGRAVFAGIESYLPHDALQGATWLTTFQEDNSRRGTDDLVFVRASGQSPVAGTLRAAVE